MSIMSAQEVIQKFAQGAKLKDPGIGQTVQFLAAEAQMKITDMHSRAIGAHCECMGMNSENMLAVTEGKVAPYRDADYQNVLLKWRLTDENNKPII